MDRNYPAPGFGDLSAGAGWSYERSPKASLVYGSSRSSHPDTDILHRQAYATPHPLQGYATNHHPAGLSGLFETGLHHAGTGAPDASVMNLISALESRGPQPGPSASSLLSQFRTPSWQTAMHTPAPAELFISGALPGSGTFPSSSALSAYQHPASFTGRSFPGVTSSLSLQDATTFSPTSNGLLSPHDPLLHIKTPPQASALGFDRLLSSQGTGYRGGQDAAPPPPPHPPPPPPAPSRHLPPPQFNLLSSQLQDQSSQLYNTSVFSTAPPPPSSSIERAIPRQDSVIKHYQRPSASQSQLSTSAAHSLQHYLSCGAASYQQMSQHHHRSSLSCSPLGDQSPVGSGGTPSTNNSDQQQQQSKSNQQARQDQQAYRPIIQPSPAYSSGGGGGSVSSVSNSGGGAGKTKGGGGGYSSSGGSRHTPTSSSSSSSSAGRPSAAQAASKSCQSVTGYGSPASVKTGSVISSQTPPQQATTQASAYSPGQPPSSQQALLSQQSYGQGFGSPQAQDLTGGTGGGGAGGGSKGYGSLGAGQGFNTDVYGGVQPESGYSSLPASLGAGSPSLGYGATGHSPALSGSLVVGGGSSGGSGGSSGSGAGSSAGSGGFPSHLPDSSPSPSGSTHGAIIRPSLQSPGSSRATQPSQSPGNGVPSQKYLTSVLSPSFLGSPPTFQDSRARSVGGPPYHSSKSKAESDLLAVATSVDRPEDEDDDDFLIQHLLQSQSPPPPTPQSASQQAAQQQVPPPSVPSDCSEDSVAAAKGLVYEMSKSSEERYQLQSVIRTNSANNGPLPGTGASNSANPSLERQLELSLHHQSLKDKKKERGGRPTDQDSLASVVHYSRTDPYNTQELKKAQNDQLLQQQGKSDLFLRKTPDQHAPRLVPDSQSAGLDSHTIQQQQGAAMSLLDSSPDHQGASQAPPNSHLLQSVLAHTPRKAMEQHPLSQHHHLIEAQRLGGMGTPGAGGGDSQSPTSQLQLQLQSQALEAQLHIHVRGQPQQSGSQGMDSRSQSIESQLLDHSHSISQPPNGEGAEDHHRHHHGRHHRPPHGLHGLHHQRSPQEVMQGEGMRPPSHQDLQTFLGESDLSLSAHHNPHPQHHHQQHHHHHHLQPHHHPPQTHHHQMGPQPSSDADRMVESSQQVPQTQMDTSKDHQFDPSSPPGSKQQAQPQQRFVPLTSICFPDSLLQDEDRSFFPGMEDMFCGPSDDYSKSSCAGGGAGGPVGDPSGDGVTTGDSGGDVDVGRRAGPDGGVVDQVKSSSSSGYDMMSHTGPGGYGPPYCQAMAGPDSGNGHHHSTMHLDLDSLKQHELPSTVNTEQLGLIQSQPTSSSGLGIGGSGAEPSVSKHMSTTPGLTSPIFCSSRPKKLLKTSSFHLLKRRDPQSQPPPKKTYAQEYEFEDDEDKADVPADIRLNSRRLPDLLPDLISSCRKSGGRGSLSPMMGDLDFCNSQNYHHLQPPITDGPKKRGRKPTKPKREGPPRPRGRPRIRPLPLTPVGTMGGVGEIKKPRGRGRGRGKKEEIVGAVVSDQAKMEPLKPLKIKLALPKPTDEQHLLVHSDPLSGSDPSLSDNSAAAAAALGLSPGPGLDLNRTQEKIKLKVQEVEEKQPEMKSGFMASFLDFLKSGKRQQLPSSGSASPGKGGRPSPSGQQAGGAPFGSPPVLSAGGLDSSEDEEDSVSKNQDLQKSISSAISALYDHPQLTSVTATPASAPNPPTTSASTDAVSEPSSAASNSPEPQDSPESDAPEEPATITTNVCCENRDSKAITEETVENEPPEPNNTPIPEQPPAPTPPPPALEVSESPPSPHDSVPELPPAEAEPSPQTPEESPDSRPLHLAKKQDTAAICGESEDEEAESGGEGIFRERDEFVVRVEDIQTLKLALQTGREPPPIWRVQKALLQKFTPEIKDGQRQFCATSNYLGYFGDAKNRYQRLYVKFLENVNKKDYVRVCSRKPWHRPLQSLREKEAPVPLSAASYRIRRQNQPKTPGPSKTLTPPKVEREVKIEREEKEKEKEHPETDRPNPRERLERDKERLDKRERPQEKEKPEKKTLDKAEKKIEKNEKKGEKPEKKGGERSEKKPREATERERPERAERKPAERPEKKQTTTDRSEKTERQVGLRAKQAKQPKVKAEPPPKKRKKWLKEVPSSSDSESSAEQPSEEEERLPAGRGLNTRAMKEMFRSYVEMLVSTALDPDMIQALEDTNDELYLPPMRKIDNILNEHKRKVLRRISLSPSLQEALHSFPQLSMDPVDSTTVKVRLGGEPYNRKTLNKLRKNVHKPQDFKLGVENCKLYSLYHGLHHYKYHTFLRCKKETDCIEQQAEDPGQEEVVQQCMANHRWLETLFESFSELLTHTSQACA
ncbi:proline-rich protein 12 isoform X2 [Polypterus senegalus]|uniref:proline-rich protein 12 isoform X2 n=1 Tax=Polypterus senegalus TaxID=55291 RepID=UPI001963B200|nr:proline-rich protein 12 isoform X2 [Polypterus senegalus]